MADPEKIVNKPSTSRSQIPNDALSSHLSRCDGTHQPFEVFKITKELDMLDKVLPVLEGPSKTIERLAKAKTPATATVKSGRFRCLRPKALFAVSLQLNLILGRP